MIEETIVEMVLDDNKITGYILDRLYPEKLPQDVTLPAMIYYKVSAPEFHDIDVAYPDFSLAVFQRI